MNCDLRREKFVLAAMQGLLANPVALESYTWEDIAERALHAADQTIKRLDASVPLTPQEIKVRDCPHTNWRESAWSNWKTCLNCDKSERIVNEPDKKG